MKTGKRIAVLMVLMLCLSMAIAAQAAQEVSLDEKVVNTVAGKWYAKPDLSISIGGQLYDGYCGIDLGAPHVGAPSAPHIGSITDNFATLDIRGWDKFRARIGYKDQNYSGRKSCTVTIEADGEQVWKQQVCPGEKAVLADIPLTGRKALTLRVSTDPNSVVFAEPKVIKGNPSPQTATTTQSPTFSLATQTAAPFVVDPNDLERLATSMRKRVDAKPDVKARVDRGKTALMTFTLVDIGSQSVATNVAEDLYTSMINSDFRLVERGQLDKLIKELKIQDSALIDPATAQKIGQVSGCDMIVLGSISDRGGVVVVNARIMETSTGTSIVAERIEMKKNPINR